MKLKQIFDNKPMSQDEILSKNLKDNSLNDGTFD
jgi:hypothetical protein